MEQVPKEKYFEKTNHKTLLQKRWMINSTKDLDGVSIIHLTRPQKRNVLLITIRKFN